ncbi:hypothetical protein TNCV_231921 [Trichonephila clavipes]|nr:hypothetical protein TNCV_231921 [Trichonephila clavipes]
MRTRGVRERYPIPLYTIIPRCRTSLEGHNAAVQHPLSTVSPESNLTVVVLHTDELLVSKDNFIPFCPTSIFHRTIGGGDVCSSTSGVD